MHRLVTDATAGSHSHNNMNRHERISIERIEQAIAVIGPEFLNRPHFECEPLSAELGARVVVKIETINPIRSFKGRGSELYMSKVPAELSEVVCASAGNFGQAMAYSARRRAVRATVFAARNANPLKLDRMRSLGADVRLFGEDFDAARGEARRAAGEGAGRLVVDSLDIETVEGAGTIGLELLRLPERLDILLVALGNGALFNGIAHVMKVRSPATQVFAVGAEGASAMVDSCALGTVDRAFKCIDDCRWHRHQDTNPRGVARHAGPGRRSIVGQRRGHYSRNETVAPSRRDCGGAIGSRRYCCDAASASSVQRRLCGRRCLRLSNLTEEQIHAWL